MSYNRNRDDDRAATKAVLAGQVPLDDGHKNWLGHRCDAATAELDKMLLTGATKHQMASLRSAINEHLRHLREVHGLPLTDAGGVWLFDRLALGA